MAAATRHVNASGGDLDVATPRLVVRDLRICLQGSDADVVSDVNLEVSAGEILGLVGESGSGKTTVALALLAHARRGLTITGGSVEIAGTNILALAGAKLQATRGAQVAYVPQDPGAALNPALRIGTQLREALASHPGAVPDIDARITEMLEEVRLPPGDETLRRYPHQFSGGQQQRLAIAMAFACRPSLIVLDEPTTGLDVTTQRHVLDTIRRLCAEYGVAGVYVTHDLAVVAGLVTAVAVMYGGRIVEVGPTKAVFDSPTHPYTRGLIAALPSPDRAEQLLGIEGRPPRPGQRPVGCSFAPRCELAKDLCRQPDQPVAVSVGAKLVRCVRAAESQAAAEPRVALAPAPPRATEQAIVRVTDLRASYQGVPVLHGVSLALPTESCLAIVGESGSGKTTLAKCIVGMHREFTGSIQLAGSDVPREARKRPREALRSVQYIFQNPYTSLNPRKTIGQIVEQPLRHFTDLSVAQRRDKVGAALTDVSLSSDFTDRYPDQLSGGERQRVAIARALIVDPDVLVCDEVTSALDVSVQAVIVELLRRLRAERKLAMVFITHNIALVRSIADEVVVLSNGRQVESGPVSKVLDEPTDDYTTRLLADVPRLSVL